MAGNNNIIKQGSIFGDAIEINDVESIEFLTKQLVEQQKKLINTQNRVEKIVIKINKTKQSIESIKSKYSKETII